MALAPDNRTVLPVAEEKVNIKRQSRPPPTIHKTFLPLGPIPVVLVNRGRSQSISGYCFRLLYNPVLRHFLSFCLCEMVLLVLHRKRSRFQSRLTYSPSRMSEDNSTLTPNPVSQTLNVTPVNNNTDQMLYPTSPQIPSNCDGLC